MKSPDLKMVYIFGSDGVGKTTHADLLSYRLASQGMRTRRSSVKLHHTFAYLLLKWMTGGEIGGKEISYYGFHHKLSKKIRTPWKILEITSLLPAIFYKVIFPYYLGYIVICDRYIFDSVATLSIFLKDPSFIRSLTTRFLLKLVPKKAVLYYLECDTDLILQRKKDEPLSKQLIEAYKIYYETLIKCSGFSVIRVDTSFKTIDEVQKSIVLSLNIE